MGRQEKRKCLGCRLGAGVWSKRARRARGVGLIVLVSSLGADLGAERTEKVQLSSCRLQGFDKESWATL